jgi:hydroxymethylpyrimidine/phosphomethylpyrimidine kinase
MPKRSTLPVALTIAGSDSGGGAGIQADLKTFAALGVHGTSVITCLTAQNPKRILGLQPSEPFMVSAQLGAVFMEWRPQAVKTGMLFSAEIVGEIVKFLTQSKTRPPLIVDPVLSATSGARLLEPEAVEALKQRLLPLATLVTPNIPEAEALTGLDIGEPEDMRRAARLLRKNFGCPALIKGGHLAEACDAVDIFYDGKTELLLSAPFIKGVSAHGSGCTFSAAIAAYCAHGHVLSQAVRLAKEYITNAMAHSVAAGGHDVLNYFWKAR